MTMIVQLLVFTFACALGAAEKVPHYTAIADAIRKAEIILRDNVLSMEDAIPLLDDSRRHYAEILHVIMHEALSENNCLPHDYFADYQENINTSAAEALVNPQKVIDEVKELIELIYNRTHAVSELVTAIAGDKVTQEYDRAIYEEIKKNPEKYADQNDVYLAAGIAATELNTYHSYYFDFQSHILNSHNFVITGAATLKKIVDTEYNLYLQLWNRNRSC